MCRARLRISKSQIEKTPTNSSSPHQLSKSPISIRRFALYALILIIPRIIVFLTRGEFGLWRIAYYVELGKLMETHGVLNVWIIGAGSNYVIYSVWLMSKLLLPNTPETAFLVLWLLIMIITDFFTSLFIYKVANMLFGQKRAWLALLLYAFSLTSLGLYMDFNIDFLTVALMMISFYYLLPEFVLYYLNEKSVKLENLLRMEAAHIRNTLKMIC